MKIIYILPSLEYGGAELRAIERINTLCRSPNVSIKLIVLSGEVKLLHTIDSKIDVEILNMTHAKVLSKKAFIFSLNYAIVLRKSIQNFKPDIIVASLPISHHLARVALLLFSQKVKLYIYHHATQYIENPVKTISQKFFHRVTKLLSKKIDFGHIFISNAVEQDISRNLQIKNGHVLYNAIPDLYEEVVSSISNLNTNLFNIVIPGRLTGVKGHLKALDALSEFLKLNADSRLYIIGEGSERKPIEDFIEEKNLSGRVLLLGNLSHVELLRYLYDCDIVLIPSLSEGLGNVAIEALMMGATTVVSNVGGLKEVINSNEIGYLYDVNKPEQLLDIVQRIYNKENFLNRKVIRSFYLERFTLEKHVSDFNNIINKQ